MYPKNILVPGFPSSVLLYMMSYLDDVAFDHLLVQRGYKIVSSSCHPSGEVEGAKIEPCEVGMYTRGLLTPSFSQEQELVN